MPGRRHCGTFKAHSDRWLAFVRWCRSEDGPRINDARQIDRQTLLDYAEHLRHLVERSDLAIATAQNRLSSVNRTLAALRGDQYVKVPSPSKALGMRRTSVRHSVPQGQDREQVKRIVEVLCENQQTRVAAIAQLARATGMRYVRRFWPTFLDCNGKPSSSGGSTSRTAPKVAVQARQHLVGLR